MNKQETATIKLLEQLSSGRIKKDDVLPMPYAPSLRGLVIRALVRCEALLESKDAGVWWLSAGPTYKATLDRCLKFGNERA